MANIYSMEKHIVKATNFACLTETCGTAIIKTHLIFKILAVIINEIYVIKDTL